MANEGYDRDFPGNPNPLPQAPKAPALAATGTEPVPDGGDGRVAGTSTLSIGTGLKAEISAVESASGDGGYDLYLATDDDPAISMGRSRLSVGTDLSEILKASGAYYNADGRTWEGVPQETAKMILADDLPIPQYVSAKYRANKAMIANGAIWTDWLRGNISIEDARGRGNIEDLKAPVKDAPLFVWQGSTTKTVAKMWTDLTEAGVSGIARRVVGETAGQAAFLTDSPMAAALGMTLVAPLIATRGAAAPAVAVGVAKALELGAGGLVFKRAYEIEGGNAAAEMIEKGFDEVDVKKYAPLVGIMNGALEVVGFHMIPAPFKRVLAGKVLNTPGGKRVLTGAYVN